MAISNVIASRAWRPASALARMRRGRLARFGAAVALSCLAMLAGALVSGERTALLLLLGSVLLSAWYGGAAPAAVAIAVSAAGSAFLFLPPYRSFAVARHHDVASLGLFVAEAAAMAVFTVTLQRSRARAAAAARRLARMQSFSSAVAKAITVEDVLDTVARHAPFALEASEAVGVLASEIRDEASPEALALRTRVVVTSGRLLVAPMVVHDQAIGVVRVRYEPSRAVSDEDRAFARTLARECALMLDRTRLLESEQSARREAETERRRFESVLMQAPIAVAVYSGPDNIVRLANARWLSLSQNRRIGSPLREVVPHLVEQGALQPLDTCRATGQPSERTGVAIREPRESGVETRYYDVSLQPMKGADGAVSDVIAAIRDVTDVVHARQMVEEARAAAEQASRVKDEFLGILSHELRTPLTSLLMWAQLLRRGTGGERDPKRLERGLDGILRSGRAQARLVEDVLDVSRIVLGKMSVEMEPVDLAAQVRACVDEARPTAGERGIELAANVAGEATMVGDASRLRQIVHNLLSNAIKFTPRGGRIEVALTSADGALTLRVRDTGEGIPAKDLPHIFERFRQVDSSPKRRAGGLGLGLAIVHHLVRAHGGTVRAESEGPHRGSTFTVVLPARSPAEKAPPPTAAAAEAPPSERALSGLRVLIVDDDANTLEVLDVLLRARGAVPRGFTSPREALDDIVAFAPDVVIGDIGMPEEDGHTLIRKIRALPSPVARVPAIALSGYARPEDVVAALESGYQLHLSKPADPEAVIDAVARVAGEVAGR